MAKVRDLVDIIEETVELMTFPMTILEVVGSNKKNIRFCDVLHSQEGFIITINGNPYKINGVGGTIWITINTDDVISVGDIAYLYKPKFTYGTPIEVANESIKIPAMVDGFPLVWLRLNFTEKINSWNNSTAREANVELYFLTLCKHDLLPYADLSIQGVQPMRSLAESFIDFIQSPTQMGNYNVNDINYEIERYEKLGIYIREKGQSKTLIGKNLTGVCLSINLKFWRGSKCLEC